MKNTIQKSALSTNLIAFVFVLFGAQLHAQDDDATLINVTSLAQLNAIRYDLDGNGTVDNGANAATYKTAFPLASDAGVLSPPSGVTFAGYELRNNLDFKNGSTNTANFSIWAEGSTATGKIDAGWESIGDNSTTSNDSRFTAIFEGNGHPISNLFINRSSTSYVGLFGYVGESNAEVRNIGLLEVNVTGDDYVGGLVGNCRSGTVSNSYATGSVTGVNFVGGLVGYSQGNISDSYATGAVTGNSRVGGLVGDHYGTVSNSYATGAVMGNNSVGGLVGLNSGTITASYYNSETTEQSDTGKGDPKTTTELQTPTGYMGIYATWDDGPDDTAGNDDDTDYWDFGTNLQYPVLKIDVNGNGIVGDAADLLAQRPLRLDADGDGLIEVSTLEQLNAIRYDLDGNGEDVTNEAAYSAAFGTRVPAGTITGYELMNDLDFKNGSTNTANFSIWAEGSTASGKIDAGWESIGDNSTNSNDSRFTAIFEGNGHTISNLFIDRSSTQYIGLFGLMPESSAELRNIGLLDVKVTGNNQVGGLVGSIIRSTVSNSYATGAVTGVTFVGGLVGRIQLGAVSGSYATGSVTGNNQVGGLVGANLSSTISNSYATSTVTSTGEYVGGLTGDNAVSTVSRSYATGAVIGVGNVGGLVGGNENGGTVSNSYATGAVMGDTNVGGLVGNNNGGTVTASYYNSETTEQSDTGKGEPNTTADLLASTGYMGIYDSWDDDSTDDWDFGTNLQYPVLKIDVNGDGIVGDAADLRAQRHPRLSVGSFSLDFVEVNTASPDRMTYNLTGTNLTGNVALVIEGTNSSLFSVDMPTISPAGEEISGTTVTVTFDPAVAGNSFEAMITHSGGGLTTPVVVNLTGSAVSPTLTSTESNLDFGDVNTSSTPGRITYDLTGENLTEDVTLVIGGATAGIFTISPTGSIAQSSGTVSQMITVTFNPTAAQRYSAMITHSSGGLTTPLVVSLAGTGTLVATPTLEATPNSLDFRDVNTASTTTNEMTYNLTGANLTGVVTLERGGTDASLFSVDMATISPAGDEISGTTVTVTFDPAVAGDSFEAMITHSGGGLTPVVVNLTGSAVSPTLTSTESNLNFGDLNISSAPGRITYDLTGANLTEDVTLELGGTDAGLFTISPTGPIAQSSGVVSQQITVTFNPTVVGNPFTAMITHRGGGLTTPLVVSLEGAGTLAPTPTLEATPNSLEFVQVNTASTPSRITYDLTGANLTGVVTLELGGTDASLFSVDMPTISPAGGAISGTTVTVTFEPTDAGSFTAMITHSGGGLTPVVVNLMGSAVSPTLTSTESNLNFGDLNIDSTPGTITYNLTGTNLTEDVTLVIGGPDASRFTIRPTGPIAQSSGTVSQMITVTFNPTAAQAYNAMITHSSGGLTPVVVSLTGAGTLAATPTLEATPNSLDFVQVNTASTPGTMTYSLTGANLTGEVALVIEGTNADLFSVDMATISPAGNAILGTTVTVTFRPTTAGDSFAAMITHSGGGLAPVVVNLAGSAVSPTLTSTESNLDFGDVSTASTTPNTMTYDLTGANLTGDVTLTIEGTNADLFTISPTGPIAQSSGTVSQMITVTFDPTAAGDSFTAMITHSSGGLTPVVVSLTGAGVPPPPVLGFATRAISNLRLSPNPVTGLLYVQGHGLGDMTVTVRSIAGKVHGSYTIRNTGKVPFSGLPSGMYIVQIVSQTGIVTKQVIKSSGL